MKKNFLIFFCLGLFLTSPPPSMGAEFNLTLNLPISSTNTQWIQFYKPWFEELKKRSGGRIVVEPYFAGVLSPFSECFNSVKDGLADFTGAVLSNSPGQFPYHERTWEIASPSLALTQGTAIMHTIQQEFPQVMKEFEGVKLLYTFDHDSEHVIGTKKPITKLEDFKGLKIITWAGPVSSARIKALGAVPVFMPPPDIYMALQQGIADGVLVNGSMAVGWRYTDMIKHFTCINILGASVFGAMNQDVFDSLPTDLQKVIDDLCGEFTINQFKVYQQVELDFMKTFRDELGGQLHLLSDAEYTKIEELFRPADQLWVDELNKNGLPGQNMYDRIRQLQKDLEPEWKDSPYVNIFANKK